MTLSRRFEKEATNTQQKGISKRQARQRYVTRRKDMNFLDESEVTQ